MNDRSLFRSARLAGLVASLAAGPALAQMANGPYYATPSWDQTFPVTTRFVVLTNFASQAVLDRETGLVWEKAPSTAPVDYSLAFQQCQAASTGGRFGWRLPNIAEVTSLFDPSVTAAATPLPAGHPFSLPGNFANFWTTTLASAPGSSPTIRDAGGYFNFGTGAQASFTTLPVSATALAWCVRAPGDAGGFF